MLAAENDPRTICNRCGKRLAEAEFPPVRHNQNRNICRRCGGIRAGHRSRALNSGAAVIEDNLPIEIYERDEWICGICDEAIDDALRYPDPMSASLDHIIALGAGGDHTRGNLQASHLICNVRKSYKPQLRKSRYTGDYVIR